ncbi:MAG TPA: ABC transporter, partial [Firmicutes bacterium]|nr:ABC transporter [Bacillota bacterium]
TEYINVVLFVLTAVAAVLAMRVAGIMLVSAMLILPPLAAMQMSLGFRKTILVSVFFSVLSVSFGMLLAFGLNWPVGGTIVIMNIVLFLIVLGAQKLRPLAR